MSATDGPSTGGYCRIDLGTPNGSAGLWRRATGKAAGSIRAVHSRHEQLQRVAGARIRYRLLSEGLPEGLIAPDTMVQFKYAHQRNLGMGIRFEVARDRLAKLQARMSEQFASLKECTVPRTAFEPMVRAALMIRPLKSTQPGTREADEWASLDAHIQKFATAMRASLAKPVTPS